MGEPKEARELQSGISFFALVRKSTVPPLAVKRCPSASAVPRPETPHSFLIRITQIPMLRSGEQPRV